MNKDVIYIDVEDDITAIIGKVKDAKEKIVALVPPKRIGVLQSAVNLRLLARAATQADKRLVLITNNSALGALAAAAQVPVAKNLQSKPEMAEISALEVDNGEDVIDGSQLPVGELAKTADPSALGAAALMDDDSPAPKATPPVPGQTPKKPKAKGGAKVPNFNKFRKKVVLLIAGGVLLLAFLVWAIFFAPRATVVITARTTDASSNAKVMLGNEVTDVADGTIKTATERTEKEASVEFEATGSKEVGEKAKGRMRITRTSVSNKPISVPAGTSFSSGNYTFVSTEGTMLSGTTVGESGLEQDSATVSVVATAIGDDYNLSARSYQSSVGGISARGTDMSGGSKKTITIVSESDLAKARDALNEQNGGGIKDDLKKEFNSDYIVLDQTFKADMGDAQPSPAVGQEVAKGSKAKLTATTTYSLSAVPKAEVSSFLDEYFKKQLEGTRDRRVYDNGADKVNFTNVTQEGEGFTGNIVATAKIGPKIEDNKIKDIAKGKRYGEIQSQIEKIQGVDDVDIKFWPFWVSQAPNDAKKINVNFNLDEQ